MTNLPNNFVGDLHVSPDDMIVYVRIPGEAFTFDGQAEMDPPPTPLHREIMRAMLLDALRTLDRSAPSIAELPMTAPVPAIHFPPTPPVF